MYQIAIAAHAAPSLITMVDTADENADGVLTGDELWDIISAADLDSRLYNELTK